MNIILNNYFLYYILSGMKSIENILDKWKIR